jgi:hypothetical protein
MKNIRVTLEELKVTSGSERSGMVVKLVPVKITKLKLGLLKSVKVEVTKEEYKALKKIKDLYVTFDTKSNLIVMVGELVTEQPEAFKLEVYRLNQPRHVESKFKPVTKSKKETSDVKDVVDEVTNDAVDEVAGVMEDIPTPKNMIVDGRKWIDDYKENRDIDKIKLAVQQELMDAGHVGVTSNSILIVNNHLGLPLPMSFDRFLIMVKNIAEVELGLVDPLESLDRLFSGLRKATGIPESENEDTEDKDCSKCPFESFCPMTNEDNEKSNDINTEQEKPKEEEVKDDAGDIPEPLKAFLRSMGMKGSFSGLDVGMSMAVPGGIMVRVK